MQRGNAMPHTWKHPAVRRHLAPVLLAALLTACAVPAPVQRDAPVGQQADTAFSAEPAQAVGRAGTPLTPSAALETPQPDLGESPASDGPLAAPSVPDKLIDKGMASWYGKRFHGRRTASGERYDMHTFTAAHKTLPFGTKVRVRSLHTGKEVVVRINDRGPYRHKRIIDLSQAAITALGVRHRGVSVVELLRE
jgi:rare lipoprotein A